MFAVEVRDHVMVAHSLPAEVFGPAQRVHGATFVVDAAFFAEEIDEHGVVVDIGVATTLLAEVLAPLRYQNLDAVPAFEGRFTTTEFLCRHVFEQLAAAAREGRFADGGRLRRIRVTLHESHLARAWYEGVLS